MSEQVFDVDAPELPSEELFKTYSSYLNDNELSEFKKLGDEWIVSSEKSLKHLTDATRNTVLKKFKNFYDNQLN